MMYKFTFFRKMMFLCLMALVAQVGFAEDREGTTLVYDFNTLGEGTSFQEGETVKNSLGESMTLLNDDYQRTGTRFAVRNNNNNITGKNKWYIHGAGSNANTNRGLYTYFGSTEYMSIMGLVKGQKVTITWQNLQNETGKISLRSNNIEGRSVNDEIVSETEYTISRSGSLDLQVARFIAIQKVIIDDGGTTNHVSFDTTGKTGDHSYNSGPSYPYYKSQLSARNFVEPAISVYPSTAEVTYTVTNYGESTRAGEKSVAVMNENPAQKNDVLFKNIGWCKVTASITIGSTTYSDSYVVWVWDNLAEYSLTENDTKYTLTGAGILENRVVTAVPGMTMTFGIPFNYPSNGDYVNSIVSNSEPYDFNYTTDNSDYNYQPNSVVVSEAPNNTGHFISYISADNGWWDRYPYRHDRFPYQGTFYTFTAKASGTLTVGGYRSAANDVIWKNRNNLNDDSILKDDQGDNLIISESKAIPMNAGQIYIIHGVTPHITDNDYWNTTEGWAVFELEWFKFESNFKIVDPDNTSVEKLYGVASECGATSVTSREKITITGISDISAAVKLKENSIVCKGSITSANMSINSDGTMTFSNITYNTSEANKKGGAIKVTIQNGDNEIDFVMTIPYGKHVWDFRRSEHQEGASRRGDWSYTPEALNTMMDNNGSDWNRVFKVASKSGGSWTELIDPIMVARGSVNGNNAFYMDNTAGLIFSTGSDSFGSQEISNNVTDYNSLTSDQKYRQPYTITTGTDLLWMKGNGTIYFPGVTANQYIKIYTYRHADGKGETYRAKNLVDLDNVAYDGNTNFIMRGMWEDRYPGFKGDNMKGGAIFRVPSNYTPTQNCADIPQLTLCDNGWVKIYRIEIMDEFEPDLIMTDDNNDTFCPVDYDGIFSSVVVRKKANNITPTTRTYTATTGQTRCQHANTCDYEVIDDANAVTVQRQIWNSGGEANNGVNYNRLSLTFNKAGQIRIIQRERANTVGIGASSEDPANSETSAALGYVIDKNEYYINVGELTVQDYPYTWDFTNHNMYQGASNTKTILGTEGSNWNANGNTFSQIATKTRKFGADETGETQHNLNVTYSCYAQGAQLANIAGIAVSETEGLGISRPTTTKTMKYFASDANKVFREYSREYEGYDLTSSAITIDGNSLTGVKKVTIPEVDNGMYIFIQASAYDNTNNVPAGLTSLWSGYSGDAKDPFDVKGGVWIYKNTCGEKRDFTFNFSSNATINAIAVTNIEKNINELGYASESRNHAIDHTYQARFTKHPVKAYAITAYNGATDNFNNLTPQVKKSTDPVTVVPANTGIVLYQAAADEDAQNKTGAFLSPLFYPAVNVTGTNSDNSILATNWMRPSVTETIFDSETETWNNVPCTRFIMTRKYYTYTKENGFSDAQTSQVEAFYRMIFDNSGTAAATKHNTMGANKAYLLVPTANVPEALWNSNNVHAPAGIFFLDLEDIAGDNGTTAIDDVIRQENESINGQDVYYSLSGVRIIGTPTTKGIYIKNGKKVSIK